MVRPVFIALLLAMAIFNWNTTCCCGESVFVELAWRSCRPHIECADHPGHDHSGSHHSGNHRHPCHKSTGGSFVPASPNEQTSGGQAACSPVAVADLLVPALLPKIQSATDLRLVPGLPAPDIPLLTRHLLI